MILKPSPSQETLAESFIKQLGEQEIENFSEETPGVYLLLLPHQNMSGELKEIAERFSTGNLLYDLSNGEIDIVV